MGRASKDKRDIYYRKAKEEGYRARSAYKLLQIHEDYHILDPAQVQYGAVDLCAAPGSWSQVLSSILACPPPGDVPASPAAYVPPPVIAVDLQEMAPIPHVTILQGDITSTTTAQQILDLLAAANRRRGARSADARASIVVCDGAPDVTGLHELDEYLQHQLLLAALLITTCVLRPGGTFVTKMFRGPNTPFLVHKSELFFEEVRVVKPKSSRNASVESFLLCQRFRLPAGYVPRLRLALPPTAGEPGDVLLQVQGGSHHTPDADTYRVAAGRRTAAAEALLVPFLSCGDLSGFDADMCYDHEVDEEHTEGGGGAAPHPAGRRAKGHVLPPVQPPLQAPYLPPPPPAPRTRDETDGSARSTSPKESPTKKTKQ
ncbi:tRNA (cytidine32/guanosine34-2'-O)-methyltransferase [Strigomonas culicis]|uniref:Putative tRNA (cytidine(32)/guanosine(34)-2'-O)-methyltransferase n=1 Tax=Strigomonas culicis TaxID=28005 RepID=S9UXD9_9TRYP|nr:tRNA (cytidine32/guanosine34-2'-O)-methyltransferase [Strigomonas culicis]|eukprot:EPY15195.1 tRNA (cytidine32/guanosine34-2'-O)-methyltransferase [Strigomonas culicis]